MVRVFALSMCFTIRHGKRLGETRELEGLGQRLESCNVSSRLVSDFKRLASVSSRTKF